MPNDPGGRHLENEQVPQVGAAGDRRSVPKREHHFWGLPPHFFWDSIGIYRVSHFPKAVRRKSQQEKTPDELIAQYTVVLAVVGGLGTVVGILSLLVIRAQLGEMQSSSVQTDRIIRADIDLASAARDQAGATKQNMELSQRAWIGPFDASIEPIQMGKPIKIGVHYQNTGRQPASVGMILGQTWYKAEEFRDVQKNLQINQKACSKISVKDEEGGQIAFPIQAVSNYYVARTQSSYDGFPGGEVASEDVTKGTITIVAAGCFFYNTFGKTRHSYFAYVYNTVSIPDPNHLGFFPGIGYAD